MGDGQYRALRKFSVNHALESLKTRRSDNFRLLSNGLPDQFVCRVIHTGCCLDRYMRVEVVE